MPDAATETFLIADTPVTAVVEDPVVGQVRQGWRHSMWTIDNPVLGLAHLTDGSRVVTDRGDGSLWNSAGWLGRFAGDRHVNIGGHRYRLHQASLDRARLLRDGTAIGVLHRTRSGHLFRGGWSRSYRVVRWDDPSDLTGIAIAHLLASRYGVGSFAAVVS